MDVHTYEHAKRETGKREEGRKGGTAGRGAGAREGGELTQTNRKISAIKKIDV